MGISPRSTDLAAALHADLRWLSRLAQALEWDVAGAEDAAQEAWLHAQESSGAQPADRASLARGLRRALFSRRRASARRRHREQEVARQEALPSTAELLSRNEEQRQVWDDVLELPEPFSTTLLLHFQEDLQPKVIASRLGIPADTVRWRVRRGLEMLREAMQQRDGKEWRARLAFAFPLHLRPPAASTAGALSRLASIGIGMLGMTKELTILALGLTALVTGWAFLKDPAPPPAPAPVTTPGAGPTSLAAGLDSDLEEPVDAVDPERRAAAATGPAVVSAAPTAPDTCTLTGRLVDPAGLPVAEADIEVGPWGDWQRAGRSDSEGSFLIECPIQRADEVSLEITAGVFLSAPRLSLGHTPRCDAGPLTAAGLDLGTLQLEPCGVLEGQVRDTDGRPIAGAWVSLGGDRVGPYALGFVPVQSGPNGHYRHAHVPPGEPRVEGSLQGYRVNSRTTRVEAGRITAHVDLTLEAGPVVRGVVVDEHDRPIPGAVVSSRAFYRGWTVDAGPDGRFEVALPGPEAHEVSARAAGYVQGGTVLCQPGDEDVRLRLSSAGVACTFVVLDATDGRPVERFGLRVRRDQGGRGAAGERSLGSANEPASDEYPGGAVTFLARPGRDLVEFSAPGYLSRGVEIEPAAADGQAVRLTRSPGLCGRVLRDGVPVQGAEVVLQGGALGGVTTLDGEPGEGGAEATLENPFEQEGMPPRWDLQFYEFDLYPLDSERLHATFEPAGFERHTAQTDAQGRFLFEDLAGAVFRLTVTTADRVQLFQGPIAAPAGRMVDLGELSLSPAGVVSGRLVPQTPGPLAGHTVSLRHCDLVATTDQEGAFHFPAVPPGVHELELELDSTLCAPSLTSLRYTFRLGAGETRDLRVPVANEPSCEVILELVIDDRPAADVSVALVPLTGDDREPFSLDGPSDEQGVVRGAVPADGPRGLVLRFDEFMIELDEPLHPIPGGVLRRAVTVELGTLELELPEGFEVTEDDRFELHRHASDGRALTPQAIWASDPEVSVPGPLLARFRLPAGEHELRLELVNAYDDELPPAFVHETRATVVGGETVRVRCHR